jgi:hypothetical protein
MSLLLPASAGCGGSGRDDIAGRGAGTEFLRLAAPEINSIRVLENGPLAVRADLRIADRPPMHCATLCRCGASRAVREEAWRRILHEHGTL